LRLGREAPWYMSRLAAQAQCRRSRLNSNVRRQDRSRSVYLNVVYECDQMVSQRLSDSRNFLAHLCRKTEPFQYGGSVDAVAVKLSCYEGGHSGWRPELTKAKFKRRSMCRDSSHKIQRDVSVCEINAPLDHSLVIKAERPSEVADLVAKALVWAIEHGLRQR
jgi:hypothetical protein